ncbi:hypothetical protein SAY87_031717 [Trapa incisa]|uniref:Uncharacterized protein n=1 Tax=Trapa incisa TaxID=236973 RepID=A0AAN7QQ25_9MYRT|nr:hypothetical protein SAY87_031717 [Trapa incisa]
MLQLPIPPKIIPKPPQKTTKKTTLQSFLLGDKRRLVHLASMEAPQRRDCSGNVFTFPSTRTKDCGDPGFEFEFGSVTPESPSSDMSKNSPADHLFFNGKLLPHHFPSQTRPNTLLMNVNSRSIMPSRTSSISSKDSYSSSLMSSRSSSVNSSRSSYSGDGSDRRLLHQNKLAAMRTRSTKEFGYSSSNNKGVMARQYGSQRWQFIAPMPALSRETSSRRKKTAEMIIKEEASKPKNKEKTGSPVHNKGFCRKFLESFMSTCRQFHAMEAQLEDEMIVCECS